MTEVSKTLAINIIRIRKNLGWNQDDLAKRAGVTRETISRLENKNNNFSAESLSAVASAFGVKEYYLITDHTQDTKPSLWDSLTVLSEAIMCLKEVPSEIMKVLPEINWANKDTTRILMKALKTAADSNPKNKK